MNDRQDHSYSPAYIIVLVLMVVWRILGETVGYVFATVIFLLGILLLIVCCVAGKKAAPAQSFQDHTSAIVPAIHTVDALFDKDIFLQWVREALDTLHAAQKEGDWQRLSSLETPELLEEHRQQIEKYSSHGLRHVIKGERIQKMYLHKYVRYNSGELLQVYMEVYRIDYILLKKTGKIIQGFTKRPEMQRWLWTFQRSSHSATPDPASCPHCGAPMSAANILGLSGIGKCEYCGFFASAAAAGWKISNMERINQNTRADNRGVIINEQ